MDLTDYIARQRELAITAAIRVEQAKKLRDNATELKQFSDSELRIYNINQEYWDKSIVPHSDARVPINGLAAYASTDPVYSKLGKIEEYALMSQYGIFSEYPPEADVAREIKVRVEGLRKKIEERRMTETEYNSILNAEVPQILESWAKEIVTNAVPF